jgi:hypothetical protein
MRRRTSLFVIRALYDIDWREQSLSRSLLRVPLAFSL